MVLTLEGVHFHWLETRFKVFLCLAGKDPFSERPRIFSRPRHVLESYFLVRGFAYVPPAKDLEKTSDMFLAGSQLASSKRRKFVSSQLEGESHREGFWPREAVKAERDEMREMHFDVTCNAFQPPPMEPNPVLEMLSMVLRSDPLGCDIRYHLSTSMKTTVGGLIRAIVYSTISTDIRFTRRPFNSHQIAVLMSISLGI